MRGLKAKPVMTGNITLTDEQEETIALAMMLLQKKLKSAWRKAISVQWHWNDAVGTAATCGYYLYFSLRFMLEECKNESQRAFVIAHETLHIWLRHGFRGRQFKRRGFFAAGIPWRHDVWNKAADYVINAYLVHVGLEPPEGFPICLDPRFTHDMYVDDVYITLMEELANEPEPEEPEGPEGEPGDPGEPSDDESDDSDNTSGETEDSTTDEPGDTTDEPGDDDADDADDGEAGKVRVEPTDEPVEEPADGYDKHFEPVYDEDLPEDERERAEEADDDRIRNDNDKVLDEEEEGTGGYGGTGEWATGGLKKRGADYQTKWMPWKQALMIKAKKASRRGGRANWGKINRRRLMIQGYVSPTRKGRLNTIVFQEDISGSVLRHNREKYHAYAAKIIDLLKPREAYLMFVEGFVHEPVAKVKTGAELLNIPVPSGCIDSMELGPKWCRDNNVKPDLHVVFGDGRWYDEEWTECVKAGCIIVLDHKPDGRMQAQMKRLGVPANQVIVIDDEL